MGPIIIHLRIKWKNKGGLVLSSVIMPKLNVDVLLRRREPDAIKFHGIESKIIKSFKGT